MKKLIVAIILIVGIAGALWWLITSGMLQRFGIVMNAQSTQIKHAGVLRVGTDATFYPMESLDEQGTLIGFDVDFAGNIAKAFGVPVEVKNIIWDNIFTALDAGDIDVIISSVTITPERMQTMSFSKPYFNAGQVILTVKESPIKNTLSLRGKRIGMQANTTSETEAKKLTDAKNVFVFADYDLAITSLLKGELDAVIMDYPVAIGKTVHSQRLKVVGGPFTQEFYGVVVSKGKEGLLEPINRTIESMITDGTMKQLENKWLQQK